MWKQIKLLGLRLFLPKLLEKIFLGLEEKDIMKIVLNETAKYKPLQNSKNWQAFIRCIMSLMDDWKNEAKSEFNRFGEV